MTQRATYFCKAKHIDFLVDAGKDKKDSIQTLVTNHFKINGVYWDLTALYLLDALENVKKDDVISFIKQCYNEDGGFGGNIGLDSNVHYTLSAIQVLCLYDALDELSEEQREKIAFFVSSLQQPDGSFSGDSWGEIDTRFSYCAVLALTLLGKLEKINKQKAIEYLYSCQNFDGGFGVITGAESHAGQTFCCVSALSLLSAEIPQKDRLCWWLAERQVKGSSFAPVVKDEEQLNELKQQENDTKESDEADDGCGGLNGRPEKLPDVCYSWWVLSCLCTMKKLNWIDSEKLVNFILRAQDLQAGGIADRNGDVADVYHTYFGIAGLSLLNQFSVKPIDPVFALPRDVVLKLGFTPF